MAGRAVPVRVPEAGRPGYATRLGGGIRETASRFLRDTGLGLSLSGTGIGATFQRQPRTDPLPALHALLDLPVRLGARHGRSWVVLDEFHELFAVPGAEGILRAHVQHHRDVAGYAFAGSERTLLDRMFADRARPFFGQAEPQRLGRLAASALAGAITDGFARTERHVGDRYRFVDPLLPLWIRREIAGWRTPDDR